MSALTYEQYRELRALATPEQWERVQDKARWEHMTPWAVLNEWPSLRPASSPGQETRL